MGDKQMNNDLKEQVTREYGIRDGRNGHIDYEDLPAIITLIRTATLEWIPVSERLPERDVRVLVFYGDIYKAHVDWQSEWHDSESGDYLVPTHWMPLPEPPIDNLRGTE